MMCPYCGTEPMIKFTIVVPEKKVTYLCDNCGYSENGADFEEDNE